MFTLEKMPTSITTSKQPAVVPPSHASKKCCIVMGIACMVTVLGPSIYYFINPSPDNDPDLKGTFMVIGDWGWDETNYGRLKDGNALQKNIANAMQRTYTDYEDSMKFIISVGDNFYPSGIATQDDPKWKTHFKDIYGDKLTHELPWFSAYGNHDYEGTDDCAKIMDDGDMTQCVQVNVPWDTAGNWVMPHTRYSNADLKQKYSDAFNLLEDLDLELIVMDNNLRTDGGCANICKYALPSNYDLCCTVLWRRDKESVDMLKAKHDEAVRTGKKSVIVVSHYPTDYMDKDNDIMNVLRNDTLPLAFFGGHRHAVYVNTWGNNIGPNQQNNWLVGGGGGWSCDWGAQGFVLGKIYKDGTIKTELMQVENGGTTGTCGVYAGEEPKWSKNNDHDDNVLLEMPEVTKMRPKTSADLQENLAAVRSEDEVIFL